MKKNKLYTANKWNRPAFMPKEENIFWPGGSFNTVGSGISLGSGLSPDILGGYKTTVPGMTQGIDWTNGAQRAAVLGTTKGLVNGFSDIANFSNPFAASSSGKKGGSWLGLSKEDNPFSKQNLKAAFSKEGLSSIAKGAGAELLSAGAGMVGGMLGDALSGGLSSGAGSAITGIGSTLGGAVGAVNPLAGAAVTFASNLVGGAVNGLFGEKVDAAKLGRVEGDIAKLNSFTSNAGSFDEIQGPEAVSMDTDVYEGGLFNDVSGKNEELKQRLIAAKQFADRSVDNNVLNLQNDQLNNALANYSAFGGPLDMGGGALDYGLAMNYLTMKKQQNEAKNRVPGISPMPAINTFGHGGCFNPFALGGDTEVPQDNTKVFRPMMLPIQRQQNFSDSEYFWDAGKEYSAGLWKHKDGTFHTTGSYGNDIVLTQEEADSIIRATKAKNRREKLRKAMENHKQNTYANGGQMYSVGQTYNVSEEEANRLKAMGYEFTVIS